MNVELTDDEKRALPCFQNPGPWQDCNKIEVQRWAARQCVMACSQKDWCHSERLSTLDEFNTATGVWAGRIYTHRGVLTSHSSPDRVILSNEDHSV